LCNHQHLHHNQTKFHSKSQPDSQSWLPKNIITFSAMSARRKLHQMKLQFRACRRYNAETDRKLNYYFNRFLTSLNRWECLIWIFDLAPNRWTWNIRWLFRYGILCTIQLENLLLLIVYFRFFQNKSFFLTQNSKKKTLAEKRINMQLTCDSNTKSAKHKFYFLSSLHFCGARDQLTNVNSHNKQ
jgi:hypothetical protein